MNKLINKLQTTTNEIPNDWVFTNAGSVVSTISKTFNFSQVDEVVFLNTSDVFEGRVLLHDKVAKIGLPGQAKKSIQKDDILFSEIRPKNRRFAYVDFDAQNYVVSTKLMVLRTKGGISPRYFFHYITSNKILDELQMLAESRSGTFPQITFSEVASLNLFLPPRVEQDQIVAFIDDVDKKIELNRRMNKTLEEMGMALFKRWFVDDVEQTKEVELQDIIEFNPRESLIKGHVATYLEMKDLPEQGMWVYSQVMKPYKGGTKFRNGDTLMARITPCLENGKSGFVNFLQDDEVAFGSTEYIVLRPKNKKFEEFIYFLVRDDEFRDYAIKSMIGSSGRQRVQTDAVKQFMLPLPSESATTRFHDIMQPIFIQIKSNALVSEKLSSIRDLLLARLMSGKLRVQV